MRSPETAALSPSASAYEVKKISFDQSVLDGYADFILAPGGPRAIRVREVGTQTRPASMVVVARHDDVTSVLMDESVFSLSHYDELFSAISPPEGCLYMRNSCPERTERGEILRAAAARTPWFQPEGVGIRQLARETVEDLLKSYRARPGAAFDIIGEYGYFAPYKIACSVIGVPGPQRPGLLEWLFTQAKCFPHRRRFTSETAPYFTQFVWSQLVFAQLFSDFENRSWLKRRLGQWAERQFRAHIKSRMDSSETGGDDPDARSLLSSLRLVRSESFGGMPKEQFEEHVVFLMLELVGTALLIPGMAFADIVSRWVNAPDGRGFQLETLAPSTIDAFVDESLRLSPPQQYLLRNATRDTEIGGVEVKQGEYVCALTARAGMDRATVPKPWDFVLDRAQGVYLHFGPENGPHRCFGRPIAVPILGEMMAGLKRCGELQHGPMSMFVGPERMIVRFDPNAPFTEAST